MEVQAAEEVVAGLVVQSLTASPPSDHPSSTIQRPENPFGSNQTLIHRVHWAHRRNQAVSLPWWALVKMQQIECEK